MFDVVRSFGSINSSSDSNKTVFIRERVQATKSAAPFQLGLTILSILSVLDVGLQTT